MAPTGETAKETTPDVAAERIGKTHSSRGDLQRTDDDFIVEVKGLSDSDDEDCEAFLCYLSVFLCFMKNQFNATRALHVKMAT